MVSKKPYRAGLDLGQALRELRSCAGTQFDPALVELFCEHVQPQVGDWAVERFEWPADAGVPDAVRVRE